MEEKAGGEKRSKRSDALAVHAALGTAGGATPLGKKPTHRAKQAGVLYVQTALADAAMGATVRWYEKKDIILLQGEPADALFYVQSGAVKLSVLSRQGNEATIALLGQGNFFGEACVTTDRALCRETATALTDCSVVRIKKRNLRQVLHRLQHPMLAALIFFLSERNQRVQEDLVDLLFNGAEKRLARTLLLLAGLHNSHKREGVIQAVSQQILAEMIGVTRQRVNFFMNRFRKAGFIEYDHTIKVRQSLRSVLSHD